MITPLSDYRNTYFERKEPVKIQGLVNYIVACLFSPSKSTLLQAVHNGNLITWPAMTVENVNKYYEEKIYTGKGHLNQERKNLRSTRAEQQPLTPEQQFLLRNDYFPHDEQLTLPTNDHMCLLMPFKSKDTGFFDLTGRFPYPSSQGNQYIMIMYSYDHNAILAEPTKSRQSGELKKAFLKLYSRLADAGAAPNMYICDNECSADLKQAF